MMQVFEQPSGSPAVRTWAAGLAIALLLHATVIAAGFIATSQEEEPDDDAAGVSVPIEMVSVAYAAPSEVAPRVGTAQPEIAAQVANDAKKPKPAEAEKSDNKDPPPEHEGEVALPKPATEDAKDESKTEDKHETEEKRIAQTIAAQEAAAPSTVSTPPMPPAPSASPGISPSQQRSRQSWQKALVTQIDKFKRYPDGARNDHVTGEVTVVFVMDRKGDVLSAEIVQGSGNKSLDEEALAVLQRAKPLPNPPENVAGETFQLKVPIRFRIK